MVQTVNVSQGYAVRLTCPIGEPTESSKILWFRAGGEQPITSSPKNGVLLIESATNGDFGTYYCGHYDPKQSSNLFLAVNKFIVTGNDCEFFDQSVIDNLYELTEDTSLNKKLLILEQTGNTESSTLEAQER